jgi:type III restriction enzyme
MAAQFQYSRLAHQAQAVKSLAQVFDNIAFQPAFHAQANPLFNLNVCKAQFKANIEAVRKTNGVSHGQVDVDPSHALGLSLDIMMETGTGKTFTFIESMHLLHQRHGLSKFIVLVPSNAIRQGTLNSLRTTAEFFAKEYNNQKIAVYNYSDKTIGGFLHAANRGIAVMVSTYQSFAGVNRIMNQRGVEANLFGHAKSYMEGLAALSPVLIIDEPHRFEGKETQTYLAKFKPLLTLRFGATFRREEYRNLIYTLDSVNAFRQRLVKGITVDTVGLGAEDAQMLCLREVTGSGTARSAKVAFKSLAGKNKTVSLQKKDNLGEKTKLPYLNGHVVENITKSELLFTNGFALPLQAPQAMGMLAEDMQSAIIERTVDNHFEREEKLFKRGIKSLTLFFIDGVGKYVPHGQQATPVRQAFEQHYLAHLQKILAKPNLDTAYRAYLERSAKTVDLVHKGYFAASHSDKAQEDAINLILKDKEKLLSFDTDLRFIFSMWALQEGWDNPNVFTLCKLAPSPSKITKLQQIGRGLRLAVNQKLERISHDEPEFDAINDLMVVVPASEAGFVEAIQSEITAHSLGSPDGSFDAQRLVEENAAPNATVASRLLDKLAELGVLVLDDTTAKAKLVISPQEFQNQQAVLQHQLGQVRGHTSQHNEQLMRWLGNYMSGASRTKRKESRPPTHLKVDAQRFQNFKELWDQLNRHTRIRFELNQPVLVQHALASIEQNFQVLPLIFSVTRHRDVEKIGQQNQVEENLGSYPLHSPGFFSLGGFVRELANQTRLSFHTVADILRQMPEDKFRQIRTNEQRALIQLCQLITDCIYELLIQTVSYELLELKVQTALTDCTGQLLDTIPVSLCGSELHSIHNQAVRALSLYADPLMPVDSDIERDTVDESQLESVTVFAKLPRINIPTPLGKKYNPDFGYAVHRQGDTKALYLVVETKGYDNRAGIEGEERFKIDSAKKFFEALKAEGVPVEFVTKINGEKLGSLVASLVDGKPDRVSSGLNDFSDHSV